MPSDRPTSEELRQLIEDANAPIKLDEARRELVEILESDEWEIVRSAEKDGKKVLSELGQLGTRSAIVAYCLRLLKTGFKIRAIGMGEPQGSRGIAHVMKNADEQGLYIKIKIEEEDGFRRIAKILSFHR